MLPAEEEESPVDEAPPRAEKRPERPAARQQVPEEPKRRRQRKGPAESYEDAVFWAQQDAAVEIELELPTPPRKKKRAMRDLQVYLTSQARKKRLEVSERRLSPEERAEFKTAKLKELKQYLKHEIVEALPKYLSVGGRWRLVYDETYTSAKKRKTNGTQPLEDVQKPVTEMDSADSESSDDALT